MNMGSILKWGLIVLAGWFLLRWLTDQFSSSLPDVQGGSMYGNGWAAPITGPGYIRAWAPPYRYGSRRRGQRW